MTKIINDTNFLNLTPHAINLHDSDGNIHVIPSSGVSLRLSQTDTQVDTIAGFPVNVSSFSNPVFVGHPDGNPDVFSGVSGVRIVSIVVLQGIMSLFGTLSRNGITYVSVGLTVRNDAGQIVGCRGFSSL